MNLKQDPDIKRLLRQAMKFVHTRGYFWKHQIPIQTVPKLFRMKEQQQQVLEDEKKVLTSEQAQQLATSQLMKVLQGQSHFGYLFGYLFRDCTYANRDF